MTNLSISRRDVFLLAFIMCLLTLPALKGLSQTCRISCGTSKGGTKNYIEVFEYDYVTDKPKYPGGEIELLEFINHTRVYPCDAYNRGIHGRVVCQFVVNADGVVSNVEVVRGVEASLDKEACRVLKLMPAWEPGRHHGKAVPVRVVRSVPFRR